MWKFSAVAKGITPVLNDPNIGLESAASEFAAIMEFWWGGAATTSTAMRTIVARAAEGVGAATALTAGKRAENQPNATIAATRGDHATTKPAPAAGELWGDEWNAHGGVVRWLAEPGGEIIMLGVSTVIQENEAGTAQSTYGFGWGEF